MRPVLTINYIMHSQRKDLPYYEVEAVLDRRVFNSKVYYLVKWKNFPQEEATWEHSRLLPYIRPLIRQFNANAKQLRNLGIATRSVSINNNSDQRQRFTQPIESVLSPDYPSGMRKNEQSFEGKSVGKPRQCALQTIAREMQKKLCTRPSHDQKMDKLDVSEINVGGEKASFGLPASEEEDEYEEEKAVRQIPPRIRSRSPPKRLQSAHDGKAENSGSIDRPSGSHSQGVKRVCMLQRVDGVVGKPEFFVEMDDGRMEVVCGRELMERFPAEMLDYFERLVIMMGKK